MRAGAGLLTKAAKAGIIRYKREGDRKMILTIFVALIAIWGIICAIGTYVNSNINEELASRFALYSPYGLVAIGAVFAVLKVIDYINFIRFHNYEIYGVLDDPFENVQDDWIICGIRKGDEKHFNMNTEILPCFEKLKYSYHVAKYSPRLSMKKGVCVVENLTTGGINYWKENASKLLSVSQKCE